ncbi:MAG: hypothetical protein JKX85_09040, partial [Phycisphaeraceae bacterium]|nr:hypothetical protein [Phycisphaeraceae bacterium]
NANTIVVSGADQATTVTNLVAAINAAALLDITADNIAASTTEMTLLNTGAGNASLTVDTNNSGNLAATDFASVTMTLGTVLPNFTVTDATPGATTFTIASSATSDALGISAIDGVGVHNSISITGSTADIRITAMETYGTNTLVAYRKTTDGTELVFIDQSNGNVESRLAAGVIDADLAGFAIDSNGRVNSVHAVTGSNSQLWQSESFAQIPSLVDGDMGTLDSIMDVVALTISASDNTYIVTANDTGYTLEQVTRDSANFATGTTSIGHIVDSTSGGVILDINGLTSTPQATACGPWVWMQPPYRRTPAWAVWEH